MNMATEPTQPKSIGRMNQVTQRLIEMIDNGPGAWAKPWRVLGTGLSPINAVTRKRYSGGNRFALAFASLDKGYTSNRWATYKQWESIGAQVREKEKGETILAPRPFVKVVTNDEGEEEEKRGMSWRVFYVFSAEQVDGVTWDQPTAPGLDDAKRLHSVEAWVRAIVANGPLDLRHGGDSAYWASVANYVQIPNFDQFISAEHYYSTLFHEMTHWTAPLVGREHKVKQWGDASYAAEELVAELGAAFLCADHGFGLEPRPDHAQYLADWLTKLKEHPTLLWTAASQADVAVKHLDGIVKPEKEEQS